MRAHCRHLWWPSALALALVPSCVLAAPDAAVALTAGDTTDVALTIYTAFTERQGGWRPGERQESHFALVKDRRRIPVQAGVNWVRFSDVAAQIEPTSVSFVSLTDPGSLRVREQTYRYDFISQWSVLQHSVGKRARFWRTLPDGGSVGFEGTLLTPGSVIRTAKGIVLDPSGSITLDEVPEGLIRRPELLWKLHAERGGEHVGEVAYFAGGVSWQADYRAVLAPEDDALALAGWVTVDNRSGATYPNAALQLVAGDVHRAADPVPIPMEGGGFGGARAAVSVEPQFVEESFFEYHLYTLQGRTTLTDRETKQIQFLDAPRVQAQKVYLFDAQSPEDPGGHLAIPPSATIQVYRPRYRYDASLGAPRDAEPSEQPPVTQKVRAAIEIRNSTDRGLGMPLPKGKVALYKRDAAGIERFVGEDRIEHTPKDENVRLLLGNAIGLTGTRQVLSWDGRAALRAWLRNAGPQPVEVQVFEHLPEGFRVIESSVPAESVDAFTARFRVAVPAQGEAEVRYVVGPG